MAVKRSRRSISKTSFEKHFTTVKEMENKEKRPQYSCSELDFCNASPKMKNRKLSQCDINLHTMHLRSSSHNSRNKPKGIKNNEKISNKESGQKKIAFIPISITPILDRSRKNSKWQKRHFVMTNSRSSESVLETSILTRLQKKSLDLNGTSKVEMKNKKSSLPDIDLCSMRPRLSSKNPTTKPKEIKTSEKISNKKCIQKKTTSMLSFTPILDRCRRSSKVQGNVSKTTLEASALKKSLDLNMKPLRQSENEFSEICSTDPFIESKISTRKSQRFTRYDGNSRKNISERTSLDCSTPIETVKDKKMLSNAKVKHGSQRITNPRKYCLRSQSEKKFKHVKPAMESRKRLSLPLDDLVCKIPKLVSKSIRKNDPKPNPTSLKISKIKSDSKVLKTVEKKRLKTEKSICLTRKLTSSRKQTRQINSTPKMNTEKHNINNHFGNEDSNAVKSAATRPSIAAMKNVDSISLSSVKIDKKSKRHTFPMCRQKGLQNSIPNKGTLKRKRWIFNTLKERNDGYEDDIFESRKFHAVESALKMFDDESDTTDSIATPKCEYILTPSLPKKTPLYKECISSKELLEARKSAEEYLYRRNKKWKSGIKNNSETPSSVNATKISEADLPEKKKLDYSEVLQNVINAQKHIKKLTQEESEEEDDYFSEASD